jgi:phosphoglycolate phosphatase
MKKFLFYDLDGTLVDTRVDIARSANHMMKEMGGPPIPAEEVRGYVGRGLYQLVASCLKTQDMKRIEQGAKIYRAFYAEHMMDHSVLYPGAREILEYFSDRKQAVITNKPNPFSRQMLEALGVAHFFTDIVAGDSEYPKKPNPSAVKALLEREKVKPQEAGFIGDSVIDIETARGAGIHAAVVLHGFAGEDELKSANPDLMAPDFPVLLGLLKSQGW